MRFATLDDHPGTGGPYSASRECARIGPLDKRTGQAMAITVFLSTVSDEFRAYRDQLRDDLDRHDVSVKVQEQFKDLGGDTLDKLDVCIAHCDAVVHLVGEMCGAVADERQQKALLAKHSDLQSKLPPLGEALKHGLCLPYTQWEAWLALCHAKPLMIAKAAAGAQREPNYAPTDASHAAQAEHLKRLEDYHRYSCEFASPDELAKQIAYSAILDLLVADYAEKAARDGARGRAEGFIREMAKRVAGDKALDLDGMKQAVRNAIEIYEKEIAGRPVETNLDDIVNRALARAKEQVDRGQSGLARATLRKAAAEMQREEAERRERYEAGVTTLYTHERDIALATHDGEAAADAVALLADAIHGAKSPSAIQLLNSEAQTLYRYGYFRGSTVHLIASIALWRKLLSIVSRTDSPFEWAAARTDLGFALLRLGERESGTARLEEAVAALREATQETNRSSASLQWAKTQNELGFALLRLSERESGTARLVEAVAMFREAAQAPALANAPVLRVMIRKNLGLALTELGERESGTARLEEAVAVLRDAAHGTSRSSASLHWALTQNNIGGALLRLGERESGTARLEEAVAAYRAAFPEETRVFRGAGAMGTESEDASGVALTLRSESEKAGQRGLRRRFTLTARRLRTSRVSRFLWNGRQALAARKASR